jgi:hypothetical protein
MANLKQSNQYKYGIIPSSGKQSFQFIPGEVKHVVLNSKSRFYTEARDLNSVITSPHSDYMLSNSDLNRLRAYPLLRGITDTPNPGDQVLLTEFGDTIYYLGPINTINNPNVTMDTMQKPRYNDYDVKVKSNSNQDKRMLANHINIPSARLQKISKPELDATTETDNRTQGDVTFEGRFGSSIRLGTRAQSPLILISNGRDISIPFETAIDGSLISILSRGTIEGNLSPFTLGSDSVESAVRLTAGGNDAPETSKFDYTYGSADNKSLQKHQIYIASDRIIFNARENNITLSAFKNIDIGAGNNLTINTNKFISIESSNIYLGKQAQSQKEPLVLGEQLRLILEELVSILEQFKVSGTVGGISGPPAPDVISKIINLKNKLSSPAFFSEYHYIEDNGQKA